MYVLSKKPQTIYQVFLSSLKFWKEYFWQLLFSVFITVLFGSLPAFIVPRLPMITLDMLFQFVSNNWHFILAYLIIMIFLMGFVIHRAYALMYKTKATTLNSFYLALKKLPYLIIALVIYDITVFLGVIAFVIPGVGFIVLLSMYFIVIMVENANPFSGFKKSWLMVTNYWWHVFAVLLLLTVFTYIASYLVGRLSVDLWVIAHPIGQGHLGLGTRLLRLIADLIFFPYYLTTLMVLYQDLKIRNSKEVIDSSVLIESTT